MKKKTIILIGIIVLVVIASPFWGMYAFIFVATGFNRDFISIDKCLDAGGRWNYKNRTCEMVDTDNTKQMHLPDGWRYPADTLFQNEWINEKHETFLNTTADFDGNGYLDSAFILESNDGENIGIFVFFLDSCGYKSSKVFSSSDENEAEAKNLNPKYDPVKFYKLVYGIRIAPIGTHPTACGKGYWECEKDEPEELILRNPGINFFHYEAGGTRYFYFSKETNTWRFIWMDD